MKRLLLILIAAMSLCACGEDDNTDVVSPEESPQNDTVKDTSSDGNGSYAGELGCTGNYMDGFFTPTKLTVVSKTETNSMFFSICLLDYVDEHDKSIADVNSDNIVFFYDGNGEMFKKYAEYYGDTTYNGCHWIWTDNLGCRFPISQISIVADKDFDESHPVNTSLNDIFYYESYSYYDMIHNDYSGRDDLQFTKAELSDLSLGYLEYYILKFYFKQQPATPGTYTFTVSITFDPDPVTGDTISLEPATTTITFE